jgi:hypothetical protein
VIFIKVRAAIYKHSMVQQGRCMKTKHLVAVMIAMLLLVSCSGKDAANERLRKAEALAGPALDAVDLTIVIFSLNNPSVKPPMSDELKLRLARYNGNTGYEIKCDRHGSRPVMKDGIPGIQVAFLPGADLTCTYKGALGYVIKLKDGEVGIVNRGIYVKEGTKLSVNNDPYVFFEGKWKRSG